MISVQKSIIKSTNKVTTKKNYQENSQGEKSMFLLAIFK